jgi:hypothetical protein
VARDPACLEDVDAVLLDGANAVCGASRLHFPSAARDAGLALGGALLLAAALRKGRVELVAFTLMIAAAPGLLAVAGTRADAPARRAEAAADLVQALDPLTESAAPPSTQVRLARNDDGPFAPLFFYAHPRHTLPADGDAGTQEIVEVREGALRHGCDRDIATKALVCGEPGGAP